MKRKILAAAISVVFAMGMLSGCGSQDQGQASSTASEAPATVEASSGSAVSEVSSEAADEAVSTEAASTEEISAEETTEAEGSDDDTIHAVIGSADNLKSPATGVLLDGAMHTYIVKFPECTVTFDVDDDCEHDVADGVLIGTAYTFTFDDADLSTDAITVPLKKIEDSDTQPVLSPDELGDIGETLLAVESKDMTALSSCVEYPVYVGIDDGVEVKNADDFMKLDASKIYTDELMKGIETTDLMTIDKSEAGVVLGDADNGHTVIVNAEDGCITGINP